MDLNFIPKTTEDRLRVCSRHSGMPFPVTIPRRKGHTNGEYHIGIQAYVFTHTKTGVQLLVNRRSETVDISKNKLDQLAIQVLEEDISINHALSRGLKDEIGLNPDEYLVFKIKNLPLRIEKKYSESLELFNREFIYLYFIYVPNEIAETIASTTHKISSLHWEPFQIYAEKLLNHPENYTKTARFYVYNDYLRKASEEFVKIIEEAASTKDVISMIEFNPKIEIVNAECYQSADEILVLINEKKKEIYKEVFIYDGANLLHTLSNVIYSYVQFNEKDGGLTLSCVTDNGEVIFFANKKLERHSDSNIRRSEIFQNIFYLKIVQNLIWKNKTESYLYDKFISEKEIKKSGPLDLTENYVAAAGYDHHKAIEESAFCIFLNHYKNNLLIERKKEKATIVCMPGTFDPPSIGHVRTLLNAIESTSNTTQSEVFGFFVPLGDHAPGPNGIVWKEKTKSSYNNRYSLCQTTSKLLGPILSTCNLGYIFPHDYGLELCIKLAKEYSNRYESIELKIVVDAETWNVWKNNFREIIAKHQQEKTNTFEKMKIVFVVQSTWETKIETEDIEFDRKPLLLVPVLPILVRSTLIRKRHNQAMTLLNELSMSVIY
ncbi:MAG: hypothetical protein HQK52_18175 [Oligoflexia bacterium]|nr:hypothetical protein [Oligoflexia bacterium]